jgi:protein-tyrosine phosphatase
MIDWHSHLLPGIDDGAKSLEESLELGRLLAQAGFTKVHCTPHCLRGMYDNRPVDVRDACRELQSHFDQEQIQIQLYPGMEYCLDEFFPDYIDTLQPLGESRFVLVESSSRASTQLLKENVFLVKRAGFEPLFAHPERHSFLAPPPPQGITDFIPDFISRLRKSDQDEGFASTPLAELIEMGCLFQCNLGSVAGYYGQFVQKQALRFLRLGLYHCVGSDSHDVQSVDGFLIPGIRAIQHSSEQLLSCVD